MGFLDRFKNRSITVSTYKLVTTPGDGYFAYDGKLYKSDIVRACIRPKAQAIGKIVGKHIRETVNQDGVKSLKVNPDVYMRFLLEEPNPYMTGQMMQEKLAVQLELTNNAFAYIERDMNGYPMSIYPIVASSVEALQDESGELYLRFINLKGKIYTFRYTDIIHLRKDYNADEIFGESPAQALTGLMEIVTTTDQGIVKAIKNSNVVKWLLKFNQSLRPEDIKKQTKDFVESYLDSEKAEVSGAAATDSKMDATQVQNNDYVPNAAQMDKTVQRIYSFFNTNDKIIQSKYSEDEFISYYESNIEPVVQQMAGEYTRKLFSRRERGFGNSIQFQSSNLTFASLQTKLGFVAMVDRGAMTPNEWRSELGLPPLDGGDEPIRRLDTAVVQ